MGNWLIETARVLLASPAASLWLGWSGFVILVIEAVYTLRDEWRRYEDDNALSRKILDAKMAHYAPNPLADFEETQSMLETEAARRQAAKRSWNWHLARLLAGLALALAGLLRSSLF